MKKLSTIALLLAIVVFVPVVYARSTVPVMERENVSVVTGSGKPVNNEALKRAIVSAAPPVRASGTSCRRPTGSRCAVRTKCAITPWWSTSCPDRLPIRSSMPTAST